MPKWFFGGRTGYSFLDVWSISHFAFWVYIGSATWTFKTSRWKTLGMCVVGAYVLMAFSLLAAYVWEVFERRAEVKWPKLWLNPESWWNAWISDPLMCVLGLLFMWYALDHWRVP